MEREQNRSKDTRSSLLSSLFRVVAGAYIIGNIIYFASLIPVVRLRGAPYLPTSKKKIDVIFSLLNKHLHSYHKKTLVDLGSGDGRVVIGAAKRGFTRSIGYEINPFLCYYSSFKSRLMGFGPPSTKFLWADFWKKDFSDADVVVVYGLDPIMERLGRKLNQELKPGSYIVSNVFQFPGWIPIASTDDKVLLYLKEEPKQKTPIQ
eukprot:TRINITY_DN9387_c0_g1_i1.p1 TRINITY_DN9387_c0_g1~~TRINITY_DN9387_c0_g1_i1.p1  ORF type:complete len:205 (-),score=33.88 TRINITY_DN9387_c0_g1_i1:79-693(-)